MTSTKYKYELFISKDAQKFIKNLPIEGTKFLKAFREIIKDHPLCSNYDIKKIKGKDVDDLFRLRLGKYKAIFTVVDNVLKVFVLEIDSRGDIYKS